ncbi:hypothetical protein vBVcaS_HC080 [Vibrio phage vB_VcaS_HC]|nr:hypothetical protein vBVcaS_HC080 [Vibrio phage vB_VcaS_HC]
MVNLTLEDVVLIKTLLKVATGDAESLSPAMVRHYIHGSGIEQKLNKASFMVEAFEIGDLPKLSPKNREETIFKSI